MVKLKRWLSVLMALMLVTSVTMNASVVAFAADTTATAVPEAEIEYNHTEDQAVAAGESVEKIEEAGVEESETEPAETDVEESETEVEETEAEESETEVKETDVEESETEAEETDVEGPETEAEETDVERSETENENDSTEEPENVLEKTEEVGSVEALKESEEILTKGKMQESEDAEIDENMDLGISVMSLLPLEEKKAYLVLNDYAEDEIKAMPISKVLSLLEDRDGNPISYPSGAASVWVHFKTDEDNLDRYDHYSVDSNETVDLSEAANVLGYVFEMVVGSGNQLDAENIRYIVKVYTGYPEKVEFELYSQGIDSTRTKLEPVRLQFVESDSPVTSSNGNKIRAWNYACYLKEGAYVNPYLCMTSQLEEHPDITVKIYEASDFLDNGWNAQEITDQLLNQDMTQKSAGYRMLGNSASFFVLYYLDGIQVDVLMVNYLISGGASEIKGDLYVKKNDTLTSVIKKLDYSFELGNITDTYESGSYIFTLNSEYDADNDYYLKLNVISATVGNVNEQVEKAVIGHYFSLDEVQDKPDIKNMLFSDEGYKDNYSGEGVKFTLFLKEGNSYNGKGICQITVKAINDSDTVKAYTDMPIVGSADPWFRITGANDENGDVLDTYIIENGKSINIDTMYGYGYQTVFINKDVDSIQPTFWLANSDQTTVESIYVDGKHFNVGDLISFEDGENTINATFSIIINDSNGKHTKNYNVTFVKKTSGPQLYVAGPVDPDVRSVFLDEYFEYKHDIFIANVGDEPLTDLRLELDAENVALDSYWTVGGEGNDTLAACPDDFNLEMTSTSYGELSNVAKIRLVPDGEKGGEIEGTLKIYSGDELLTTINLSGRAQNPEIITSEIDDAVLYVPYSYLITTNNMYDWTNVEFSLEGDLPEGLEFYPETGEIYGVPVETGDFTFTVTADFTSETYSFESSTVEITLTVKDNTNYNVYTASDENYSLLDAIGTDVGGYDFVLEEYSDQVFRSEGVLGQFVDLWLNGELLEEGVDYKAEDGSTKITIYAQTFEEKADKNEKNTIAAEFRTSDTSSKNTADNKNEMKRTAQNFRVNVSCSHTWDSGKITKAATCTANGVRTYTCTSCSDTYTESIPATGHTWDSGKVTAAATCTESGLRTYTCKKCSATKTDTIAPKGHTTKTTRTDATCTENGSIVTKCVVCGTVTQTQVILATGHSYNSGKITKAATCMEDGVKTYTCKNCGEFYTKIIKAEGHKYVAEITKEATETEDGLRIYKCSVCGDSFTEIIPALGDGTHIHTYNDGMVTKEATCTDPGERLYSCTQCSATKTEVILATGHNYEMTETVREATCTENGIVKYTCKNCDDAYTEPVAASGHDYDDGIVTKEPTHTKTGVRTYTCRNCGETVTEVIPVLMGVNNGTASDVTTGSNDKNNQDVVNNAVTCRVRVVDKDGNALTGLTLELHSTPQTAHIGTNGIAEFSNVEFGVHTIYLKDRDGITLASKSFNIVSGKSLQMNGSTITAVKGDTFTLTIQYDDGILSLLSVEKSESPKTGDCSNMEGWIAVLFAACIGLFVINRRRRHI